MPHASPRYSPVGSKLSVKPNEASQPIVAVPPALTLFLAGLDLAARLAATTITAPRATTRSGHDQPTKWSFHVVCLPPSPTSPDEGGLQLTASFDDRARSAVSWLIADSAVRPHVERVAEAVAEQVEGERRDDEEEAREEHQPPGDVVVDATPGSEAHPRRPCPAATPRPRYESAASKRIACGISSVV